MQEQPTSTIGVFESDSRGVSEAVSQGVIFMLVIASATGVVIAGEDLIDAEQDRASYEQAVAGFEEFDEISQSFATNADESPELTSKRQNTLYSRNAELVRAPQDTEITVSDPDGSEYRMSSEPFRVEHDWYTVTYDAGLLQSDRFRTAETEPTVLRTPTDQHSATNRMLNLRTVRTPIGDTFDGGGRQFVLLGEHKPVTTLDISDGGTIEIETYEEQETMWKQYLQQQEYIDNVDVDPDEYSVRITGEFDRSATVYHQELRAEPRDRFSDANINYTTLSFENDGDHTWDVPDDVDEVDVLVVGGGGGGGMVEDFGSAGTGGGGAGEVVYYEGYDVGSDDEIDIQVGSGGSGATSGNNYGDDGDNSEFDEIVAVGGGGGAGGRPDGDQNQTVQGSDGGSGGGSRTEGGTVSGGESVSQNVLPGAQHFGNPGGDALGGSGNDQGGSGGGGADQRGFTNDQSNFCGGRGGNNEAGDGGDGGDGVYVGEFGDELGVDGYVGGGGGGGAYDDEDECVDAGGIGGIGGGGHGTFGNGSNKEGTDGLDNTGGGGGGGASDSDAEGGDGGSGTVVIRWEQ